MRRDRSQDCGHCLHNAPHRSVFPPSPGCSRQASPELRRWVESGTGIAPAGTSLWTERSRTDVKNRQKCWQKRQTIDYLSVYCTREGFQTSCKLYNYSCQLNSRSEKHDRFCWRGRQITRESRDVYGTNSSGAEVPVIPQLTGQPLIDQSIYWKVEVCHVCPITENLLFRVAGKWGGMKKRTWLV